MARAAGASRRSRSGPRWRATPYSFAPAGCTTGQRGRRRALAGSLLHDYARARGPDAHDALHWTCSKEPHSFGSSPRVLAHRWGVSVFRTPPSRRSATWGRKERRHKGSARALSGERFSRSETRRAASEAGRAFGVSLARTTAGATLLPLCALLVLRVQERGLSCEDYGSLLVECFGGRQPAGCRGRSTVNVGSGAGAAPSRRSAPRLAESHLALRPRLPAPTRLLLR